jgi:hypothetical protein
LPRGHLRAGVFEGLPNLGVTCMNLRPVKQVLNELVR